MVRVVDKKPMARPEPGEPDEHEAPHSVGFVRKPPLGWFWGGLLIAFVQLIAVWVRGPIEVSPDFIPLEAEAIEPFATLLVADHPLLNNPAARQFGFGGWLNIGIIVGAAGAAIFSGRWRLRHNSAWWSENHGADTPRRYAFVFLGGVLVMFGAHLARGCTSGRLLSGWSQLSATAFPFTVAMIAFAMISARLFHPSKPPIER